MKGLTQSVVKAISKSKKEPAWMLEKRLEALKIFNETPLPSWGPSLEEIDFSQILYYSSQGKVNKKSWDQVPEDIKKVFEKLGIPQAERDYLAGVETQFNSEVVYDSLKENLKNQGVIFLSMDEGLKKHPNLIKKYFSQLVQPTDNKFSALNTAVWSGGSFIYVPKNIVLSQPLQAYFWINASKMGQFERTLIIVEKNANLHYIEGCSAPIFSNDSLHAGVVEIFVKKNAVCQYSTIQNWYKNIFNLVTKKALVEENGQMFWLDTNIGSKITMKYPACILKGKNATGQMLSVSFTSHGQIHDTGARMIHLADNTKSSIISKSIAQKGGQSSYRGQVVIDKNAQKSRSKIVCNSLILDDSSYSNSFPVNELNNDTSLIEHEATISPLDKEKLAYLQSRGLTPHQADTLIVSGFISPIIQKFPFEYALELNRLIEMEIA
jgi:Fe-S cluster assembly protein SufB